VPRCVHPLPKRLGVAEAPPPSELWKGQSGGIEAGGGFDRVWSVRPDQQAALAGAHDERKFSTEV